MKLRFKYLLISILLLFLVTGQIHVSSINSKSTINEKTQIDIRSNKNKDMTVSPSSSGSIVIFADSESEFKQLRTISNIVDTYPNLQAVKLETTWNNLDRYLNFYPNQVFPSHIFTKAEIFDNVFERSLTPDSQSDVDFVNVKPLWDMGYNGSNTVIAVFDNGVDFTHPVLSGKEAGSVSFATDETSPCASHGTAVAGAAAGLATSSYPDLNGTANGAMIYDIGLGCDGSALVGDFLGAFDYIIGMNETIDIVNTSWGGNSYAMDFIVKRLNEANITLVGSVGNGGPSFQTAGSSNPGNSLYGISAGAVTYGEFVPSFSAVGPAHNMLTKPDVMAPGSDIEVPTAGGGSGYATGTSFSSPLTAGVVATLVSALNTNGYSYNPGVLKAALLRGADPMDHQEIVAGQGIVNAESSWNVILNASIGADNIPKVLEITPHEGPNYYLDTLPQGVNVSIPLTLISSHPSNVSISFTGDLAGSTYNNLSDSYSQQLEIIIDTSNFSPGTTIQGTINASLGNDFVISTLNINIGPSVIGTVGIDLRHTYWDFIEANTIGGTNIGEMIKLAMEAGYWVEEIHTEINSSLLANYDILWLPDPTNLESDFDFDPFFGQVEYQLQPSEISAMVSFVENGGSLMVDFNGLLSYINEDRQVIRTMTNATAINELISHFGISTNTNSILSPTNPSTIDTINQTSLIGEASKITHYGNYLNLTGIAQPFVSTDNGDITGAVYTDPDSGGRVLVASTNFWMDNFGARGQYSAGIMDTIISENTWSWFSQSKQVIKLSETIGSESISGTFKILDNGNVPTDIPVVYREANDLLNRIEVDITDLGNGEYSINYDSAGEEGLHKIVVSYGDDYITFDLLIDTIPPTFTPDESTPNGHIFEGPDEGFLTILIRIEISDMVTDLVKDQITVTFNNQSISSTSSYNVETDVYRILLTQDNFDTIEGGVVYTIYMTADDGNGNTGEYEYNFYIGSGPSDGANGSNEDDGFFSFLSFNYLYFILPMISLVILIKRKNK